MGRDIAKSRFDEIEFREFHQHLKVETATLRRWLEDGRFESGPRRFGLELETWLVDRDAMPAPDNDAFLYRMNHPLVVPEISRFNAEINAEPKDASGDGLSAMQHDLELLWSKIQATAGGLGLRMLMIGSLPTLRDSMLGIGYMSDRDRYRALNEEVMSLRKGKPIALKIEGRETLECVHRDIMLEAATTSLQVHFQVAPEAFRDHYNASILASAPVVAAAANSPFLFGKDLWAETRIATFEQALQLHGFTAAGGSPVGRVTFGSGYLRRSALEPFLENLEEFPPLLPISSDEGPEWLHHLRMHNGTIWRWNRPIVGLSRSGRPHLRIEHRTPAAGPTWIDVMANVALYLGLTHALASDPTPPDARLDFEQARANFYAAARYGLDASVVWDGKATSLLTLLHDTLLPLAHSGLLDLGFARSDVDLYIYGVLRERCRTGRTGTAWQRAFVATHGPDFQAMTNRYFELQETGRPVHEWNA